MFRGKFFTSGLSSQLGHDLTRMDSTADHNENTPLLESAQSRRSRISRITPSWTWIQWRVMLVAAFLMFSVNFGHYMGTAPQLKIFEDIICQNYKQSLNQENSHARTAFDDNICKSEPVQSELALISGWKNTLDVLPGMHHHGSQPLFKQ